MRSRALCIVLAALAACASTSVASARALEATSAKAPPKCHVKRGSHPKQAKRCKAKPKPKPKKEGKPAKPTRTTSPSPVNLSPAELEEFDALNRERAAVKVPALSTSAVLQAIAEKRAREMAAAHADYAGHDVVVDLKDERICTRAQREISSVTTSLQATAKAEAERDEIIEKIRRGEPAALRGSGPYATIASAGEEEEIPKIRVDPTYKVVGVAILEAEGELYSVEDFAEPC